MTYNVEITPRSDRKVMITERLKSSEKVGEPIYEFRGSSITPKVIGLKIDVPIYRVENCRTFSAQQTHISKEKEEQDFFVNGQETSKIQQIQHNILSKLLEPTVDNVESILDALQYEGQREAILISNSGVVVNGNRRLCAMRELYDQGNVETKRKFEYVECAVLPSDTTKDEVEDIEANLQARPSTKLEYDWIGDSQLIGRLFAKNRTIEQISAQLRRSKTDIEGVRGSILEADLYLQEWIKKPGEYSYVKDGQQFFSDLFKRNRKQDLPIQEASRVIAWMIYENRSQVSGRIYQYNEAYGKNAPKVLKNFAIETKIDCASEENPIDGSFDIDIGTDEQDETNQNNAVLESIRKGKNKEEVLNSLLFACETTIEMAKGIKDKGAALNVIKQANSKLAGINVSTAGADTLSSMKMQISTIRQTLDRLESEINKRLD